jgi:hypothetical protein
LYLAPAVLGTLFDTKMLKPAANGIVNYGAKIMRPSEMAVLTGNFS